MCVQLYNYVNIRLKINTYMKNTQYTVVSKHFVQRDFQGFKVCTQKPYMKKGVHTANLTNPLYLSA